MACSCGKGRAARESYTVRLPGGLKVVKSSEAAAKSFAARHPGSTVVKGG
jgi:hypothetical protein